MNDVPKPKSIQKATYKTMMFGAREPKPRPTAQDRQPMILATRHPKRLTTTPITGPKNRNIAIMIELTHAARIVRKIRYKNNHDDHDVMFKKRARVFYWVFDPIKHVLRVF